MRHPESTGSETVSVQPHTVETYRQAVLALVRALASERVPVVEGLGRVTAETITASTPVPLFDNAAMDGFAVRASDVAGATPDRPVRLTVVGRRPAGRAPAASIGPGEAIRIMTGAPIPVGADLVVPVECSRPGRFVEEATVDLWAPGRSNIRRRGEDVAAGSPILAAGASLTPRLLALLTAVGHHDVVVVRRPRIAVVSSGDELDEHPGEVAGTIPDSNSVYLRAAVAALGGEVVGCHRALDDAASLTTAMDAASAGADLILSTGGLGSGSHDLIGRAAAESPGGVLARVAMRPGRPQAHGTWNGVPWIALPGNPTAAFVSFEVFARPALDVLSGRPAGAQFTAETVSEGWPGSAGAVRYLPLAVTDRADGGLAVTPAGHPSGAAHALSSMFSAPLIAVVGPEVGDVRPGQRVTVIQPV